MRMKASFLLRHCFTRSMWVSLVAMSHALSYHAPTYMRMKASFLRRHCFTRSTWVSLVSSENEL